MGRHRTRLHLSAAERAQAQALLDSTPDPRQRERLQVVLWASTGDHTLQDLARKAERVRATVQLWLDKFRADRLHGLLKRDTPPGSRSPLESAEVQAGLRAGLRARRWRSASEIADWLQEAHGIKRARKSVYYWLRKMGRHGCVLARASSKSASLSNGAASRGDAKNSPKKIPA